MRGGGTARARGSRVVFGTLRLSVGAGGFVPRQRSLLLARAAAAAACCQREPVLLEAFAGVAPVAAAVRAAVPRVEVHASDVDDRALRHAAINLGGHLALHRGDVLTALPRSLRSRVTLLVAVPPYVPVTAQHQLSREARDYEPARALFGGRDGLAHVRFVARTGRTMARAGRAGAGRAAPRPMACRSRTRAGLRPASRQAAGRPLRADSADVPAASAAGSGCQPNRAWPRLSARLTSRRTVETASRNPNV